MRVKVKNDSLSVKAIAGTEVILFGLNVPDDEINELLGFKIEKKIKNSWYSLHDGRTFIDSDKSLIQRFMWSDYQVDSATAYTYRIAAAYGTLDDLRFSETITIDITTENPDDDKHGVFFNRGVAGSQAYSRRFEKYQKWYKDDPTEQDPTKVRYTRFLKPADIPKREAYKWLSRGLEEALLDFIGQAKNSKYSIRASIYELSHFPAAQAFVDALERGADVKVIHHAKKQTAYRRYSNKQAVTTVAVDGSKEVVFKGSEIKKDRIPDGISQVAMRTMGSVGISKSKYLDAFKTILLPRTEANISHNKFIILLENDIPIQVWTGSTNLTGGGLFGQSNVGQIIRDNDIALEYFKYWEKLSENPKKSSSKKTGQGIRDWLKEKNPNLDGNVPEDSVNAIFSPRSDEKMLQWYADRIDQAKNSVFLTLAFSIDDSFFNVVKKKAQHAETSAFLRYLLVESKNAQYIKPKYPDMVKCEQNRVAHGDKLRARRGANKTEELIESLTGLNHNVNYLHTKYMIIDALTEDPIVISGSANFSKASTCDNDENMLIIRGNTRITDIYLTEFMRMFNHFRNRNVENALNNADYQKTLHLTSDDSWVKPYFKTGSPMSNERILFSVEGE
ncbi:phospholipase D-like domain-containing protein [uncultured Psychroserpens sp.]|uniref:phospholipase D-like domain-containing protein n=1 Tax=uncultured Psychroserpens sp. TaxID=255436 RepID=UPI002626699F|nr:phospholipase D-like domain-containing protein [uncultured Psychroserpens sp.]